MMAKPPEPFDRNVGAGAVHWALVVYLGTIAVVLLLVLIGRMTGLVR